MQILQGHGEDSLTRCLRHIQHSAWHIIGVEVDGSCHFMVIIVIVILIYKVLLGTQRK